MAKPGHQDLAEWRSGGRGVLLGEVDGTTSAAILNDLFGAGAVRVVAVEANQDPQYGLDTNWIVVEIPTDTAARRKLFAIFANLTEKDGWDAPTDVGQRYEMFGKFKWLPGTRWP